MQSTPTLRDTDPHDVFVIDPEIVLAARADPAPIEDVLSRLAASRTVGASDISIVPAPSIDAAFRPTAADDATDDIKIDREGIANHRPASGRFARRAIMATFALCSAVGAAAWQHYGSDAQAMVSRWAPAFALGSPAPAASEQPAALPVQAAATDQTSKLAESVAPTVNATSADTTQLMQSMARDLATMGQQIEQLKAGIAEVKAVQAQQSGDAFKTSEAKIAEPNLRPRPSPPPVRTAAVPVHKPKPAPAPAYVPAPVAAPPIAQPVQALPPRPAVAPVQAEPQEQAAADGGPVVRPPMPLR